MKWKQLGILLILCLVSRVDTTHAFTDVSSHNPHYQGIQYVKFKGIVDGYADGSFRPNSPINRAEFTKIIVESISAEESIRSCDTNTISLHDVPISSWYAKYVCVARNNKMIDGYPDKSFKPANNISFVEAAKILVNAFEITVSPEDVWYRPYGRALGNRNAIPSTIIQLDQKITRGELAEMVFRLQVKVISRNATPYSALDRDASFTTTSTKHDVTLLIDVPVSYVHADKRQHDCAPAYSCLKRFHFDKVAFRPFAKEVWYTRIEPDDSTSYESSDWDVYRNDTAIGSYLTKGSIDFELGRTIFSKDGKRSVYLAIDEDVFLSVVDNKVATSYPISPSSPRVRAPLFLSDNTVVYSVPPMNDRGAILYIGEKHINFDVEDELYGFKALDNSRIAYLESVSVPSLEIANVLCTEESLGIEDCKTMRSYARDFEECGDSSNCSDIFFNHIVKKRHLIPFLGYIDNRTKLDRVVIARSDGSLEKRGVFFLPKHLSSFQVIGNSILYVLYSKDENGFFDWDSPKEIAIESADGSLQKHLDGILDYKVAKKTLINLWLTYNTLSSKYTLFENGTEIETAHGISMPVFNDNEQSYMYTVSHGSQEPCTHEYNGESLVVRGITQPTYANIYEHVFAPDNETPIYVAEKERGCKGQKFVVIGQEEGPTFKEIITPFYFSADYERVGYGARTKNSLYWVEAVLP